MRLSAWDHAALERALQLAIERGDLHRERATELLTTITSASYVSVAHHKPEGPPQCQSPSTC